MQKVKCKNCVFFSSKNFCAYNGEFIGEGTKIIECPDYTQKELDLDGMDLTDSEIYIRGELSSQDSEAW